MIDSQLRTSGVNEPWVLRRDGRGRRARISCPKRARGVAYIDRAVPLGGGRFLAAPLVHGMMLPEAAPDRRPTRRCWSTAAAAISPRCCARWSARSRSIDAGGGRGQARARRRLSRLIVIDGAVEQLPEALGAPAGRRRPGGHRPGRARRHPARRSAARRPARSRCCRWPRSAFPSLPEFAAPKGWSF